MTVTTAGWAGLAAWFVLGLPVGITAARWTYDDGKPHGDTEIGGAVLTFWVIAPLVVVIAALAAACGVIGRAVKP